MSSTADNPIRPDCSPVGSHSLLAADLVQAVRTGSSVLVTGATSTAPLLAVVTPMLLRARTRVLHVRPPLDLACLIDQLASTDDPPEYPKLEQGFDALTNLDADCDRIALLVEDAHRISEMALRYVELALHAGPHLQVVLAGQSGIADTLALDGFAWLRKRVSLHLTLPSAEPKSVEVTARRDVLPVRLSPVMSNPALLLPSPYRMTPRRLLACAAISAGLAFVLGSSVALRMAASTAISGDPGSTPDFTALEPVIAQTVTNLALQLHSSPKSGTLATRAQPRWDEDLPHGSLADPEPTPAAGASTHFVIQAQTAEMAAVPGAPPNPIILFVPAMTAAAPPLGSLPTERSEPFTAPAVPNHAETLRPSSNPAPVMDAGSTSGMPEHRWSTAQPRPEPPPTAESAYIAVLPPPPAAPRALPRSVAIRLERVADHFSTPGGDGQRCRGIILRLQLGETPTDGDRTYLRNGCR